ncbi:hypothetical protein, partial [uncultured Nostoc sp.]|uniref:hypothetical protein n=1 Tax=uncultured Nostoc sp. TaxID=340711 RepID=UPI002630D893
GVETRQHSQAFFNSYLKIGLAVQFRKCHSIYLPFDRCSDILDLCEEQVKNKRCLGWKHGNTPRHFLVGMQKKFLAHALEFLR